MPGNRHHERYSAPSVLGRIHVQVANFKKRCNIYSNSLFYPSKRVNLNHQKPSSKGIKMNARHWLIVLPLLLLSSLNAQETPVASILRKITSLHTRIYSIENLLIKPYSATPQENDLVDWRALMTECANFVGKNGDKEVNKKLMTQLNSASENVINLRKIYYNNTIKPALASSSKVNGLSKIDPSKIDLKKIKFPKLIADLATATAPDIKAMATVQKSAENITKLIGNSKKKLDLAEKDSCSILLTMGLTMELTLTKLNKDAARLEAASK